MTMNEKCKSHVDACRFCWMCHHICPIGNATGQERNTARARALGISLVNREALNTEDIIDNIYECCTCGGCVSVCATGWDPVMFTKEFRAQAALEGKLPAYIRTLVQNCLETGNAYGKTEINADLAKAIGAHAEKTDTLFYLGTDARYFAPELAAMAIGILEKAGVAFTVAKQEPESGAQLDFLVGKLNETENQMRACAKELNAYKTVIVYDPTDAKAIKQLYKEYGIEVGAKVVTYTAFLAELVQTGKLKLKKTGKTVVYQDPYQLSRDLEETEPAREVIGACADLKEMLLCRKETVWAGNTLMAEYLPEVIRGVSERRIFNAVSIGADTMVTASPSEYAALKQVAQTGVEILSLDELITKAMQ